VQSHYDTSDKRTALFTKPRSGPLLSDLWRCLDAQLRSAGHAWPFYTVVEWDRSYVKYGSFKTAFTDTELSSYNRTLSGLTASYETLGTTAYGDPKRGFNFFGAKSRQPADHNEFAATGGSLLLPAQPECDRGQRKNPRGGARQNSKHCD